MRDSIHVKGLSDLAKFMDELSAKLQKNVMRGAMRAGMTPVKAAVVAAAPVGPPSAAGAKKYGLHAGSLRDSVRISSGTDGSFVFASVKVGGKTKKGGDVWFTHIIEFTGAAAHDIVPRVAGSLFLGGIFRKVAHHPGMKARPFIRPSFDAQAQNAVVAAAEYMKARLATKEGLDTSEVIIEVDES